MTKDENTLPEKVLIESDWNLKCIDSIKDFDKAVVLIESDWNLK